MKTVQQLYDHLAVRALVNNRLSDRQREEAECDEQAATMLLAQEMRIKELEIEVELQREVADNDRDW